MWVPYIYIVTRIVRAATQGRPYVKKIFKVLNVPAGGQENQTDEGFLLTIAQL